MIGFEIFEKRKYIFSGFLNPLKYVTFFKCLWYEPCLVKHISGLKLKLFSIKITLKISILQKTGPTDPFAPPSLRSCTSVI